MERLTRQGLLDIGSQKRVNPLTSLYQTGPLRLHKTSLKTVKAYISRANLRHNALMLKELCQGSRLCAVVKANGYGHDAKTVVSCLSDIADVFAVSSVEEAEQIFPFTHYKPILVACPLFSGVDRELVKLAQIRGFHCTVCSFEGLDYVSGYLDKSLPNMKLHLKVDTGMGRLGCRSEEADLLLQKIRQDDNMTLAGVYTHFATADEDSLAYTWEQWRVYAAFLETYGLRDDKTVLKHACNTSGTLRVPEAHLDMVRCGIGLYGYNNCSEGVVGEVDLRPVLKLEAPVVEVKRVCVGQTLGYGRTFAAPKDMTIGIVPLGYADGLFRCLSNLAAMRHGEHIVPIVGRISMDLTIIDLSAVPNPYEGMRVTVIDDRAGSYCNAVSLARAANTAVYEILTAIGMRIKRELVE